VKRGRGVVGRGEHGASELGRVSYVCVTCGGVWSGLRSASRDAVCQDCGAMNDFDAVVVSGHLQELTGGGE